MDRERYGVGMCACALQDDGHDNNVMIVQSRSLRCHCYHIAIVHVGVYVGYMVRPVCCIWSIVVYVCICQCLRLYTVYNIYTGQGINGIFSIDYHLVQAHRYLHPSLSQRQPYSLNSVAIQGGDEDEVWAKWARW